MAGSTLASPSADPIVTAAAATVAVSPGRETWRRFRRHKLAMASAVVLAFLILSVVVGPWFWPVAISFPILSTVVFRTAAAIARGSARRTQPWLRARMSRLKKLFDGVSCM